MKPTFTSKALEDNLKQTRVGEIDIPEAHRWFISLSESKYGIHNRAREFFNEFHHPYANHEVVVEQLRKIALGDRWFYLGLPEAEQALDELLGIFRELLEREISDALKEHVLQTLLEFAGALAEQPDPPLSVLHRCLELLEEALENHERIAVHSSRYFKSYLSKVARLEPFHQVCFRLTKEVLTRCARFWRENSDAGGWYERNKKRFQQDYREKIRHIGVHSFDQLDARIAQTENWQGIADLPSFDDIANHFRRFSDQFETALEKIHYIFYLLNVPGMYHLKDNLLWDINRLLRNVHDELDLPELMEFLESIFRLFSELKEQHIGTILDCLLTLGKEVVDTGEQEIIDTYEKMLIEFGFVHPGMINVSEDWKLEVDPNHVKNIRVWLELIEYAPDRMRKLLSALIVNLRLGGIFISDTDLFQLDITKLLNSKIASLYKRIKQLARIFPVYFREIGAEGELREVTTAIDELCHRRDRLLHFLRKQTHTESNNTHIDLTRKIIRFWYDGDLEPLKKYLPVNVVNAIDLNSQWFQPIHKIVKRLCRQLNCTPEALLEQELADIEPVLEKMSGKQVERDKKRITYLVRIYALLRQKYSFDAADIIGMLRKHRFFKADEIDRLAADLQNERLDSALSKILRFLAVLKEIIEDAKPSEGWENIYYKRHVAVGIPSMYGTYHEPKFEALGLTFRLERVFSQLIDKLIEDINPDYITAKTLRRIEAALELFREGLELDGITNQGLESNLMMFKYSLTSSSFSLDQYINIFQFMAQNVKDIIKEYFLRIYDEPLKVIIPQVYDPQGKWNDAERNQVLHKKSEEFYRDVLTSAFLVQTLDNFIARIIHTLQTMVDNMPPELIHNIMSFDPDLIISPLYKDTERMDNQIFLGAKAYFLKKLHKLDFPVPPGFVITTEMFRHREAIWKHPHIRQEFNRLLWRELNRLEQLSGRRFGSSRRPLLLSVRAGTAISMPGAMNTFLNVGMNDEIVETLGKSARFGWTAWDCYRRFLQSWGMAHGIERDRFDRIMIDFKNRYNIQKKKEFTTEQMRSMAYAYKRMLREHDIHFEEEPRAQLKQAIGVVIDSWDSERAKVYRENLQIAGEWGTAVIVQKMVFGNINGRSGTGVLFTHDPHRNLPGINLYGEFTLRSQGEDIVAGLVHAFPVVEYHRETMYPHARFSLEVAFPQIYQRLLELAADLVEKHGFSHQEIEFTFESEHPEDLYILQTRAQNIQEDKKRYIFSAPPDKLHLVGRGIGIGGGALNGRLAFDMQDLEQLSRKYPDESIILVRPDTVPDDIGMIFRCDGLLTGRGGATSHAAVTAARLGKVCIVGCRELTVEETRKYCSINGQTFRVGDPIAIDGHLGNIYRGHYPREYVEMNHRHEV